MNKRIMKRLAAAFILPLIIFTACEMATRDNPYDPMSSGYVLAVYVNDSGSDAYNGSMDAPKQSISAGIERAKELILQFNATTCQVRVAQGTYYVNWNANTNRIVMSDGISLYGGYSENFSSRGGTSEIIDQSSAGGAALSDPNRAVDCGTSVTYTTVIDGFTITAGGGGSAAYATAVFCSFSSPTIINCIIDGGITAGTTYGIINHHDGLSSVLTSPVILNNTIRGGIPVSGGNSYGIYNGGHGGINCNPLIINNDLIYGGDGTTSRGITNSNTSTAKIMIVGNTIKGGVDNLKSTTTYGIFHINSSPIICNNIINAGNGTDTLHAIHIQGTSSPVIYNNTIDGGSTSLPVTRACCIFISGSANDSIIIENNILLFSITVNNKGWGIYENNTTSDPLSVRNNDIYNVGSAYLYHDNDTGVDMSGISTGNFVQNSDGTGTILSTPSAEKNLKDNPGFLSTGDGYHPGTPSSVTTGGRDLSSEADFPQNSNGQKIDKDGNIRTAPWTMGAYEYN